MTEITKDWCINMAKAEEAAGDPEIGAGRSSMTEIEDWVEKEDAKQIGRVALRAAGLPTSCDHDVERKR